MRKLKDVKIVAAEISLINSVPVRLNSLECRHCRRMYIRETFARRRR